MEACLPELPHSAGSHPVLWTMEADDSTLGTLVVVDKNTFVEVAQEATGLGAIRSRSEPPPVRLQQDSSASQAKSETAASQAKSETALSPQGLNPNDTQKLSPRLGSRESFFQPDGLNPNDPMLIQHLAGTCEPCLYFTRKQDGCWRGDQCDRCHFCSPEEAKARRAKMSYEKKKARKAAAMQSGLQENAEGA